MGSRDMSRWVFKLTADPICPPLIPEWYLSLLEFYIVSSVSKSVLPLPQTYSFDKQLPPLSLVSRMDCWLDSKLFLLSIMLRTPDRTSTSSSHFPGFILHVYHCSFNLINCSKVTAVCARKYPSCKIFGKYPFFPRIRNLKIQNMDTQRRLGDFPPQ